MSILNSPRLPDNPPDEFTAGDRNLAGCADDRVSARVIRSSCEIEEIRKIWTSWQQHPNADIDFYLLLARLRPEIIRPHVIVIYRRGRPDAMLIGRIEHRPIDCNIGYKTLFRPNAHVLNFVYGGLLGKPSAGTSHILVKSIMSSLRQGEADVAYLNFLRADSPFYEVARRLPSFATRDHIRVLQTHWNTALPQNAEEFRGALPRAVRKDYRWNSNKLYRDYCDKVTIRYFREATEVDKMIEDVEEIANKTYQRGLGAGFVDNAAMRQRLQFEAVKGWLRACILYVRDRPSAFWLGTLYQGIYHGNFVGYDPSLGKYSPGMFLMIRAIEDMCTRRVQERVLNIDWGLGDAQYKRALGTSEWQEASIYIFAPSLKGLGLNLLRTPTLLLEQYARKAVEGTTLVAKIKRAWRDRVRQKQKPAQSGKGEAGRVGPTSERHCAQK